MRNDVVFTVEFCLMFSCCLSNVCQSEVDKQTRPNIIILFADDLGYGETGCQGNRQIPTPHIDSIARNGIRFTSGYVTASYCSTSRAGLLTGTFPTRFGYENNPIGAENEDERIGLPKQELTLAEHLQNAGYTTALIGKWHLGGHAKHHPYRRGFDEFFGFLHEGHYFVPPPYRNVTTMLRRKRLPNGQLGRWISPNGMMVYSTHMGSLEPDYDANNPILRGGQPVFEEEYLTDAFTREAVSFIQRNRSQPFFLYLAYNAVHSPLQAPRAKMKQFAHIQDIHRRIFAGMLSRLDDSVGTILQQLEQLQLEQRTLLFFISDNGGPTKELTSSNLPLRGGKGDLYEGGIRVPFLMQWKGELPANLVIDVPVCTVDVFATAANVANAPLPRKHRIDGVNLIPYLKKEQQGNPHEVLFWRMNSKSAIRVGEWKLVRNGRKKQQNPWELYHITDDLREERDLYESEPDKREELLKTWNQWNAKMIAPLWTRKSL